MPDLESLLTEAADSLPSASPPPYGNLVTRRRRRSAVELIAVVTLLAGSAMVAASFWATGAADSLASHQPAANPSPTSCPTATTDDYSSGLSALLLRDLAGWRLGGDEPAVELRGCSSVADRSEMSAAMEAVGDPLAHYYPVRGASVSAIEGSRPRSGSLRVTSATYEPTVDERTAEQVAVGLVARQRADFQKLSDAAQATTPTQPSADPPARPSLVDVPEVDHKYPNGTHVWIYRGLQNRFCVAWTPRGLLTVLRIETPGRDSLSLAELDRLLVDLAAYEG